MHYIAVVGSGKSSRVNIESLLDDYLIAVPDEKTLILPVFGKPTEGQVFAAQFAKDQSIDIVVVCDSQDDLGNLPPASVQVSKDVLAEAIKPIEGQNIGVFILWDDDDEVCAQALAIAKEKGIGANDLTNGLIRLTPAPDLKPAPVVEKPKPAPVEETDESDENDEDDEEDTEDDDIIFAFDTLARLIARYVAEELRDL